MAAKVDGVKTGGHVSKTGWAAAPDSETRRGMIIVVAVHQMYDVGYNGMSMRNVAAELDVALATIYHYFASKQEILYSFLDSVYSAHLERLQSALLLSEARPEAQLAALVDAHIRPRFSGSWGRIAATTAHREFEQLEGPWRGEVESKRRERDRLFQIVVEHGVREGVFLTDHPSEAARAIVMLAAAATDMYEVDEADDVDELVATFTDLALRLVQHDPTSAGA
ncbi:MAG: TetR/AcrR family transcriptional regulator [Ilumatobacteraceae bacterium]